MNAYILGSERGGATHYGRLHLAHPYELMYLLIQRVLKRKLDDLIVSVYVAGEIPATLGQLTDLIELHLGSNNLRGKAPPFITLVFPISPA